MRGIGAAKALVIGRMTKLLPAAVTTLATLESPEALAALELPRFYAAHEVPQLALDQWPAVVCTGLETVELKPVDWLRGEGAAVGEQDIYEVTYRLRLFLFARAESYELVAAARDRLVLAARQVLLAAPSLGDDGARMVPSSLRESYSDVLPDEVGRTVAAAFLELDVILTEALDFTPLGTATTALADGILVTALAPHPALS